MKKHDDRPPATVGVGTLKISARAKQLVMSALDNNRLSYGAMSQEFETKFARLHSCRFGVLSNSGTSSLHVALQAMKELHGWQDGDEVIIPALTFVATANIVLHNRMVPVLVDVESTYYEMDPFLIEAKITSKSRAIIPVHLFGHPAEMKPIKEIANRHKLKIIEDSCETMFASYEGQSVGSLGDIACFSTYVAHLLVTGVGGMSTTNNPEYAIYMRSLINHGRDSIYFNIDDDDNVSNEDLKMIIARRFQFVTAGHSFRSTEMEAALGLAQLQDREAIIASRRSNANVLVSKLKLFEKHLQLPSIRKGSEHSFMMFPLVLRDQNKEELVNFLEQRGIETRDMLPLTNQPVYHRLLGWKEAEYPVAKHINNSGFYIGCHQDITRVDLEYIAHLFDQYFNQRAPSKRGACLIIEQFSDASTFLMSDIPRELFSRVIVMDYDKQPDALGVPWDPAIELVSGTRNSMQAVMSSKLAVDEEDIVFFPADGRYSASDIVELVLMLQRGKDMVVASRFFLGGGRRGQYLGAAHRSIGNRVFTLIANLLFYGNLTDTLSGFRAIKRDKLKGAVIYGDGYRLLYGMSLLALIQKWEVAEVPVMETVKEGSIKRRSILASVPPLIWTLLSVWFRKRGLRLLGSDEAVLER